MNQILKKIDIIVICNLMLIMGIQLLTSVGRNTHAKLNSIIVLQLILLILLFGVDSKNEKDTKKIGEIGIIKLFFKRNFFILLSYLFFLFLIFIFTKFYAEKIIRDEINKNFILKDNEKFFINYFLFSYYLTPSIVVVQKIFSLLEKTNSQKN